MQSWETQRSELISSHTFHIRNIWTQEKQLHCPYKNENWICARVKHYEKKNYPEKFFNKKFTLVGTNVFVEGEPLALISAGLQYETCQRRRRSLRRQPLQKQALISLIGCQEEGRLQDRQSGDRCRFLCWHSWERHVPTSDILCWSWRSRKMRLHERSLVQTLSSHRHNFTERSRAEFVLRQHAELVASAGEQPGYQQVVFGSGHR